jgi:hypothetical protein
MALPGYDQDCELVDEDGGCDDNGIADMQMPNNDHVL